jgi:hypothetical protein
MRFAIVADQLRAEFSLELFERDGSAQYRFEPLGDHTVLVRHGSHREAATDFFYDNPPVIWFSDGSSLEGNVHVPLKVVQPPYDSAKIEAWDWTGIDIRKESQGPAKAADSIQARVIRDLRSRGRYQLIFDDDDSGEAADVVAVRVLGERGARRVLEVDFYHCKYSSGDAPGARVSDLYEVCGRAQKSIHWMLHPETKTDLFTHLLRRESKRRDAEAPSRFEVGTWELLQELREMSRISEVKLTIAIVQPGLSKAAVSVDQLRLLSVTETHLMETYQVPFRVISAV